MNDIRVVVPEVIEMHSVIVKVVDLYGHLPFAVGERVISWERVSVPAVKETRGCLLDFAKVKAHEDVDWFALEWGVLGIPDDIVTKKDGGRERSSLYLKYAEHMRLLINLAGQINEGRVEKSLIENLTQYRIEHFGCGFARNLHKAVKDCADHIEADDSCRELLMRCVNALLDMAQFRPRLVLDGSNPQIVLRANTPHVSLKPSLFQVLVFELVDTIVKANK